MTEKAYRIERLTMNTINKSAAKKNWISVFWNQYRIQILLFFVVFGTKVILNLFLKSLTLSTGNDDIGTIAGAAYFAGLDWSDVISHTLYYGWGYSMLMAPAFMLTDNVRILFQIMLGYNAALLGLSVVICYNIMSGIFKIDNKKFCVLASLAANFFYFELMDTNIIFNETALIFLFWLVLYLLLKMERNVYTGRSNIWTTVLLVLLMGYGMTVHTRFILMWGAIIVMVVVFALLKKKLLINPWVFIPGVGGIYYLANFLNHRVQDGLWLAGQSTEPLVNSIDSLGGQFERIKDLFNIDGLTGFLHAILGQTGIMFYFTGGLMLIFLMLTVIMIKRMFQKAFTKKEIYLAVDEDEVTDTQLGSGIIFIASLLIATLLMVNLGAITVLKTAIIKGWGTKWYVYSRYWGACCPMAIMLVFAYFYINKEKHLKKMINIASLIGMTAWGVLFGIFVATKLAGAKISSALVFQAMLGLTFHGSSDRFAFPNLICMLAVGGVWFLILLFLMNKKRLCSAAIVTMTIFAYIFAYKMVVVDIDASKEAYNQYIDAKWALDSYGIGYKDYKKIYVDSKLADYYNAQFALSRYELVVRDYEDYAALKQDEPDIQLALTEQIGEEMCGNWYILYQKNREDENGQAQPFYYLLVRKGELAEKLVGQGIELTDIRDMYGMEKLIYQDKEKEILNIGINKLKNTDVLEQDFEITTDMIDNKHFAIALMFRNPSENPGKGKVNVSIKQGTLEKSYFMSMDTITTRERVYVYVDSEGFEVGTATIVMTCPDMSRYKYVMPYTVALEDENGDASKDFLRYNGEQYKGKLYMQIFLPSSLIGMNIAPANVAVSDKSEAKAGVGSLKNDMELTQRVNLTEEMLTYKYLGMDFWIKSYGGESSKGEITVTVTQGKQSDSFVIAQSDLATRDYIRITLDTKKYKAGGAVITMAYKGESNDNYIKPYSISYEGSKRPDWVTSRVKKGKKAFTEYLCMNIYGFVNTTTMKNYGK